jgi:hypothetical protein
MGEGWLPQPITRLVDALIWITNLAFVIRGPRPQSSAISIEP